MIKDTILCHFEKSIHPKIVYVYILLKTKHLQLFNENFPNNTHKPHPALQKSFLMSMQT